MMPMITTRLNKVLVRTNGGAVVDMSIRENRMKLEVGKNAVVATAPAPTPKVVLSLSHPTKHSLVLNPLTADRIDQHAGLKKFNGKREHRIGALGHALIEAWLHR